MNDLLKQAIQVNGNLPYVLRKVRGAKQKSLRKHKFLFVVAEDSALAIDREGILLEQHLK